MYIYFPKKQNERKKETTNFNLESILENKVENIVLRRSGCRFIKYLPMRVNLIKGEIAKGVSYLRLPIKSQSILKTER